MKERKHERERKGGKKSIKPPGVTAAVIALKSDGSCFLIQSFKKKKKTYITFVV